MKRTYLEQPYLQSLETEAEEALVKGGEVWASPRDMLFHIEGGGQPSDRGAVSIDGKTFDVAGIAREKGRTFVRLVVGEDMAGELAWLLKSGERMACALDWDYRHKAMRCHTAAHVVMGALKRTLAAYEPKGMRIADDLGSVELRFRGEAPTGAELQAVEAAVNGFIGSNAAVTAESFANMEAARAARPDYFRADGDLNLRGDIRMLWIEGWDHNPCGGTHAAHVGEIGAVAIAREVQSQDGVQKVTFSVTDAAP